MPFPVIPAIAAAAPMIAGAMNSFSTGGQNKASRTWSSQMYDRQYQDNLAFWRMQNEYNSPQQQMARLKQAGLNPALMYGQSGAGASGLSGSVSTPDVQQAQFRSPEWGNAVSGAGAGYLSALYDYEIKQAQVDNLKADNTVKLSQAALLAAQTGRSEFDLGLDTELRDISAEARREQLRKLKSDTRFQLNEDERRAAMTSQSIRESLERILSMRSARSKDKAEISRINQARRSLSRDVRLKDLDIELRKSGINPHDPMWSRILGRVLARMVGEESSVPGGPSGSSIDGLGGNPNSSRRNPVGWRKYILGF